MMAMRFDFAACTIFGVFFCLPELALAQEKPVPDVMDLVGCTLCHQVDNRILGPSFKEVAVKYKGDKDAVNRTAERIVKGSKGVWGEVAMPPNNIKDDEARRIAAWILSR